MGNSEGSSSQKNEIQTPTHDHLPHTGISEILGLIEILKSKGGTEDIYKLAAELKMEFGDTLKVIRGAELIGLVHTPGGDVVIEELGKAVAKAKIAQRKVLIGEQLSKLSAFKKIREFLTEKEDHQARRDEVLEKLAEIIPNENAEQSFTTLVNWGRYAELFGYNDDSETFYLDIEGQATG